MSDWFKNSLMPSMTVNSLQQWSGGPLHQPTMWGNPKGLKQIGNLELWDRPVLNNADGTKSTTKSISVGTDLGETLIPTVVNGKLLTTAQAIKHFQATGEHLGVFDSPASADKYSIELHNEQARRMGLTP